MLSGAAPVGVVHCYLGCHLSGRRQGRNADAADADTDAAGSGDADDADGVFLPRLTSQGKTRTKCYRR